MAMVPTPSNGSQPSGDERRRYPRRNIALDVSFGPPGTRPRASNGLLQRTVTVNLSAGGMCLYTDTLYPVGTRLFCAITIPGRSKPIELVAEVAWFHKIEREAHGYKLGVEFAQITEQDRTVIARIVEEPPASDAARSKRLLLVDDDFELLQALKVRFESAGFQVLTATEGMEALQKSRQEHPHLIILDLMLPRLNGYEICRLLKFDQKYHHIPIILFTARSRQEDVEMGFAVGADAYVTKPFNGKALLAKVDELLTKASP